mmetsp:Transcript_6344/g.25572  ORF Transcript_6344/g.25572 Transcript_6344/m.25572 type:complete len:539 (+) Transcript_6344:5596-7212(+)
MARLRARACKRPVQLTRRFPALWHLRRPRLGCPALHNLEVRRMLLSRWRLMRRARVRRMPSRLRMERARRALSMPHKGLLRPNTTPRKASWTIQQPCFASFRPQTHRWLDLYALSAGSPAMRCGQFTRSMDIRCTSNARFGPPRSTGPRKAATIRRRLSQALPRPSIAARTSSAGSVASLVQACSAARRRATTTKVCTGDARTDTTCSVCCHLGAECARKTGPALALRTQPRRTTNERLCSLASSTSSSEGLGPQQLPTGADSPLPSSRKSAKKSSSRGARSSLRASRGRLRAGLATTSRTGTKATARAERSVRWILTTHRTKAMTSTSLATKARVTMMPTKTSSRGRAASVSAAVGRGVARARGHLGRGRRARARGHGRRGLARPRQRMASQIASAREDPVRQSPKSLLTAPPVPWGDTQRTTRATPSASGTTPTPLPQDLRPPNPERGSPRRMPRRIPRMPPPQLPTRKLRPRRRTSLSRCRPRPKVRSARCAGSELLLAGRWCSSRGTRCTMTARSGAHRRTTTPTTSWWALPAR